MYLSSNVSPSTRDCKRFVFMNAHLNLPVIKAAKMHTEIGLTELSGIVPKPLAFQILAILWGRGHPTGAGVRQPCARGECHPSRPSSTAQRTRTKGGLWEHNGEVHRHYAGMFLKSIQE